jgi:hypothetical protein
MKAAMNTTMKLARYNHQKAGRDARPFQLKKWSNPDLTAS